MTTLSIAAATEALRGATYAIVHTDGGCEPNPGHGGWGVVIDPAPGHKIELCGGENDTTNNRMEMRAAIVALTVLPRACAVTLVSDSQYLVKGATLWMHGWKAKGWKRGRKPALNNDLWQEIYAWSFGRPIDWRWIRGHDGHVDNERADRLAAQGRLASLRGAA